MVRELLGLFRAFEHEEAQQRGGSPAGRRRQVVAPNALRETLSDLDARLFSIGVYHHCCCGSFGSPDPTPYVTLQPTAQF